jgi:hypothetical protein
MAPNLEGKSRRLMVIMPSILISPLAGCTEIAPREIHSILVQSSVKISHIPKQTIIKAQFILTYNLNPRLNEFQGDISIMIGKKHTGGRHAYT